MVLAYHVILGMYGFWLPNDERGSWSEFVGAWELLRFGRATTVTVRHSLARRPFDRKKRDAARAALKYPPVRLTGVQARAIARGLGDYASRSGLVLYECAILPEHVHLVIARSRMRVEQAVNQLKGAATRQLIEEGIHPLMAHLTPSGRPPKVFSRGLWKVYLDSPADIDRSIVYVRGNPRREGLRQQSWGFVRAYRGRRG